jgi:Flp pilus assembly protein protease CpaA
MDTMTHAPLVIAGVFAALAAVFDLRRFRVPNSLTLPLLLSGIAFHVIVAGLAGLQSSLLGALFGFAILFVFYFVGVMGGGDVKLMAAVGAWLGMPMTVYVFSVAGLAAGAYSVVLLAWNGRSRDAILALRIGVLRFWAMGKHLGPEQRVESVVDARDRRQRLVPFAAMIAFAVIVVLVCGWMY